MPASRQARTLGESPCPSCNGLGMLQECNNLGRAEGAELRQGQTDDSDH